MYFARERERDEKTHTDKEIETERNRDRQGNTETERKADGQTVTERKRQRNRGHYLCGRNDFCIAIYIKDMHRHVGILILLRWKSVLKVEEKQRTFQSGPSYQQRVK